MVLAQRCGGHGVAPGTLKCREPLFNQGCALLQRSRAAPSCNRSVQRLLAASHHVHSSCLHAQPSLCQVPDVQSPCTGTKRSHKFCLSPPGALESHTQSTGWRLAMGLLALRHHPRAKEPGWAFLAPWRCCPSSSYCTLPAASLPRQTHQAGLWPCPPLPGEVQGS